ncbi:MAG: SDR family oxidoreductase [Pelagimonas sp.]|jgi:nucleoside-diphosphate-sugar epimerase|nr:SDR family oxidoreductase [Pelagimonas sp.]
MTKTLLSLGHGFSARALTPLLLERGFKVIGTTRSADKARAIESEGAEALLWEPDAVRAALGSATHLLMSAAPGPEGDPALAIMQDDIAARARDLDWVGYLSTTGVYGNHDGGWVDEDSPLTPTGKRGKARVVAEAAWAAIPDLPLHIFRLAGIYGPGRGPFEKIRNGTARRIIKPGQVFSRIHVEDIAQIVMASIERPNPGGIYNCCDNDPAPPQDVLAHAARLLGAPLPPEVDFETAELSPMVRSFYGDSKKVSNRRIREELGVQLLYPDYDTGLRALLKRESEEG